MAPIGTARTRAFYQIYGVPDTVNGRLETCSMHAHLQRLEREPAKVRALGRGFLIDLLADMDESMREMGVGISRSRAKCAPEIRGGFYGRQATYRAALAAHGPATAAALQRNVLGRADSAGVDRLAAYVREVVRGLAAQDGFERAQLAFGNCEQVLLRA